MHTISKCSAKPNKSLASAESVEVNMFSQHDMKKPEVIPNYFSLTW